MPSSGGEAMIRNPKEEVLRFLDSRHKDHYWLYNLCDGREHDYPHEMFGNRVCTDFGFDDHQAPPFEVIEKAAIHMTDWLKKDPENVIVIHCKAGKGRTGLMTCCCLMYAGFKPQAEEAMDFYAVERTYDLKGVNIPSQKRYVEYFGLALNNYALIPPFQGQKLKLKKITMNKAPKGGISFSLKITHKKKLIYNHHEKEKRKFFKEGDPVTIADFEKSPVLEGDVHFEIRDKGDHSPFKLWLNTFFIQNNYQKFTRYELDKIWNKKQKEVVEDFVFEMFFEQVEPPIEVKEVKREVKCEIDFRFDKKE
jgi:phosphatidylinositol-3,4,5-trisphosphate 3-phosphatase/dual-specificity protein phosphatase PTEN